jgi:hypothetical protein
MLYLLLVVCILCVIAWVAVRFAPEPLKTIILAFLTIVLLIVLYQFFVGHASMRFP